MRMAITALALCVAAGSAFAQSSYGDRNRDEGRGSGYDSRGYDSRNHDSRSYDSRSYGSERSQRSGDWDRDDSHHHSRHTRGATFYLKSGDKEFRVDCGDDDSTRECVDAALTMFREIQKSEPGIDTSSSLSSPSPTPSPGAPGPGGGSAPIR
ncbi:MAG: hypothetical protein Q8M31_23955 [Beijerinckiaceae bacterium]|nr:hypothetical protein [Beijerinckiaceae bacterium]